MMFLHGVKEGGNISAKMIMMQINFFRRLFMVSILMLCLLSVISGQAFGSKTDKHLLNEGELLLAQGKYLESIGLLHEIASHSENDEIKSAALFLIAKAENIYLENQDGALKRFLQITSQFPGTTAASKALFQSGIILFDKKDYWNAIRTFSKYIREYPTGIHRKEAGVWIQIANPLCANKEEGVPVTPKRQILTGPTEKTPRIRVLIQREMDQIAFKANTLITVTDHKTRQMIYSGWGPVRFIAEKNRLTLNQQPLPHRTYQVTAESSILHLNNAPYRGFFIITAEHGEGLCAINHVDIEEYLYGVVPREMPDSWEEHALMAQAVAARTYALYIKEKNTHPMYDLEATTASQVYGGCNSESKRSTKAVHATRGQVMTHDGRLIIAYFHSDSGGHTEDPSNVWNTEKIPYLNGVPDQFGREQPVKTWEYFLSCKDAVTRLNQYGLDITRLDRITVFNRSRSGRFAKIRIHSDKGVFELSGNHFRAAIGETRLKSTLFHMVAGKGGILFKGKGYGHGVGMSQWGARKMAQSGSTYQDILKFYYKGIKIKTL
ncbi:MAG: SpoIID/LytB domain-containing protein [Pseudomonadota bacterium]